MVSVSSRATKPYLFRRGQREDFPVLVPLGDKDANVIAMTQFCRRISPLSPMLILNPVLTLDASASQRERANNREAVADALISHIAAAVRAHDLALIPMIVVGHGEGADRACDLLLSHGNLFAAAILFRPSGRAVPGTSPSIAGLQILLAHTHRKAFGLTGQQVGSALVNAGAEVIFERVSPARKPDSGDAAMARVFVAALFGA